MTGPLLVIRDADGAERTVELRDGVMRIGRGADNEIIIGDAAKGVSRAHAELHIENGRCTIVDLHSQNGTWVNALRVQRAEVRPDQEVAIGVFRLRLQTGTTGTGTPSVSATGRPGPRPQPATVVAPLPPLPEAAPPVIPAPPRPAYRDPVTDLPLMSPSAGVTNPVPMPVVQQPTAEHAPAATPKKSNLPLIYGGVGALVMIGLAIALFSLPQKKIGAPAPAPAAQPPAPAAPAAVPATQPAAAPATPTPSAPPPPPASEERRSARPAAARPAATTPATAPAPPPATTVARPTPNPPAPPTPSGRATPPPGGRSGPSAARTAEAVRTTAENLPVPRKPGETVQEWQARSSALQARYAFAKVALDRGDFSAAAGGFAAILLEEPGFLDANQLLVKARDGLRAAAAEMIEAGNKLDAAGDSISALKKYDQAREIDRTVPGVDEAIKRVRDKMRTAGLDALRRARQFDALGRFADALLEYEKAAQWLPQDDPNQQIARGRADQLKARQK